MSKTSKPTISAEVMNQIKGGKVHMHHDWYFALLSTGFAVAIAFTLLVAIYAFNLILLRLEIARSGLQPWLLGRYYLDVQHFPIIYAVVAIAAVVGVIYLLRQRSEYARQLPDWSIVLGIVIFVICLGAGLSRTSVNRHLQRQTPLSPFYEQPQPRPNYERNLPPAL